MSKIDIYTDGACKGNPGDGGYAWVMVIDDEPIASKACTEEEITTNNIMELSAVIDALKEISDIEFDSEITIYSDSTYVTKSINLGWLSKWKSNNFKTLKKNVPYWIELDQLISKFNNIKFVWVKAHNGNEFNEMADELASNACYK